MRRIRFGVMAVVGLIGLIVVLANNPIVIIGAGDRGVVLNWGRATDDVMEPGMNLRVPFQQAVVRYDVQTRKHEVKAAAYSKDIQNVEAIVALNYHLDPTTVAALHREIGKNFEPKIIDPAVQEAVKAATAKFTAQELIERREAVKEAIRTHLTERLGSRHFIVDDFSIVNFEFSDVYEQAVEAKQVAQQNALKAENDLIRIKTEAEQKVASATAEATTIRIQAEAIREQGGEEYVKLQAIKAWEKGGAQMPQYLMPGAYLPFIGNVAGGGK